MLLTTQYSWICKASQITCICTLERASTLTASCLLLQLARRQAGGTLNDAERKPNNSFPIGFSMVWHHLILPPTINSKNKKQKILHKTLPTKTNPSQYNTTYQATFVASTTIHQISVHFISDKHGVFLIQLLLRLFQQLFQ